MARNTTSRHSVTRINAYSCQAEKLSESDLPFRTVSWSEGMDKVRKGEADFEYGRAGQIKGIRFREKQRSQTPTPCTLDLKVIKSVSGEGLNGIHEVHGSHGSQERALVEKFQVWAYVGDNRAVRVGPKVDAEYMRRAEKLLGLKAA